MPGSEETIFRALALRQLELPVGDFIKDCPKGEIPEAARGSILEMNILDEENQGQSISYAARAIGTDPKAESEAAKITQAWNDHPDHTVCKAMGFGERSIFFVLLPFFASVETLIKNNLCGHLS